MNSTFKVVFNKARGALMVVNEVTSSVQAKGTKTVIATAVTALMAGSAMAASVIPDMPSDVTETEETTAWDEVQADGQYHFQNEGAQGAFTTVTAGKDAEFSGKLWVSAIGADSDATGLNVYGKGAVVTNKGEIYVTTDTTGVEWRNEAILADNSAKAVNAGKIVVKNAYGMRVGTTAPATIENAGTIIVEERGVGMELGGGAASEGSVATNNGSIIVGDIAEGKYGHGVLIKDAKKVIFNNNGLIQAGEGATAIDVQLESGKETSAEINLGEKSQIDGLINIGAGTKVTLNAKGMSGKLQVKAADGTTTLNVADGSNVELVDEQKSVFEQVNVEKGTLTASIWGDDNTFKSVTVKENGVFNITKLNSGGNKDDLASKPHDTLLISRGQDFTYDHAQMYVAGKVFTGNLKVGGLDTNHKGTVTLKGGEHSFTKLTVGANDSAFKVQEGAVVTVGSLHLYHGASTAGTVVVDGSTLINTGALTFEKADATYSAEGKLELNNGTFQTAATDFFKKKETAAAEAEAQPEYEVTGNGAFLSGNGTLNLTSEAFEFTLQQLSDAQATINLSLIHI